MNTNKIILIVIAILASISIFFIYTNKSTVTETEQSTKPITDNQPTFLLDGYPSDSVPLYKSSKVSSNKIFVNTDPKNSSEFDETNFAYFNVVFETEASREDFLNYYQNLFESQITDEYQNQDMVKGVIGQYKVSAAHYGSKTGYIQVHLPNYLDQSVEKYFSDFPSIVHTDSSLIEHEKSYGLLNQKGGEVEFTKYFTVVDSGDQNKDGADDVDEFLLLQEKYQQQYQDKPEYSFDETQGTMKWRDGDYEATLSLSRDHGRIYLMLRKKM